LAASVGGLPSLFLLVWFAGCQSLRISGAPFFADEGNQYLRGRALFLLPLDAEKTCPFRRSLIGYQWFIALEALILATFALDASV
jgi:hypothetical protein